MKRILFLAKHRFATLWGEVVLTLTSTQAIVISSVGKETMLKKTMLKKALLVAAMLASTARANSGDSITVDIWSKNSLAMDQVRIVTRPRPGYDPAIDTVEVYQKNGKCVDADELMGGDRTPKVPNDCCWDIKGFHIWPELQNVEVGKRFDVDFKYEDTCAVIDSNSNHASLNAGTYNSYMVQVHESDWQWKNFERVVRFRGQDIVGLVYTNTGWPMMLKETDKLFAYGNAHEWSTPYQTVSFHQGRGTELSRHGSHANSFRINCEGNFNARDNCPTLSQGGVAVPGSRGDDASGGAGAASPIVDGKLASTLSPMKTTRAAESSQAHGAIRP
eukprot:scaffold3374_cov141-Cylindrotheca_fusiformis.AAC.5